jgi:membrane protease YdiL (CAAX protease family)
MPSGSPRHSAADILIVCGICFGWFIFHSVQSVASGFPTHSFTDASSARLVALEIIFGTTAIAYLYARSYNLVQLLPIPTLHGCLVGLALYAATVAISWPLDLLIRTGQAQPIDEMVVRATVSLLPLVVLSIVNGFYEEVFLIGYLQRALEGAGAPFAIGASLLVRVLYHLYQGPAGAISVLGFGLVLSVYFAWKRKLWPVVFAHISADIAGFSVW